MRRNGIPSFKEEEKAYWGDVAFVNYSDMPTQDLEWWRLKLAEMIRISGKMIEDIKGMKLESDQQVPGTVLRGLNCGEAIYKLEALRDEAQAVWEHIQNCLSCRH